MFCSGLTSLILWTHLFLIYNLRSVLSESLQRNLIMVNDSEKMISTACNKQIKLCTLNLFRAAQTFSLLCKDEKRTI